CSSAPDIDLFSLYFCCVGASLCDPARVYTKRTPRLYTDQHRAELPTLLLSKGLHMQMFGLQIACLALAGVFGACASAQAMDNVTLITDFGFNGRHAYFFVAIEKGYYRDVDLEVKVVRGQGSV